MYLMYLRGNSIGTDDDDDDERRTTTTDDTDRVFATLRLCTDEDGTRYFSRYIFYMVRIGTSKKGGNAPRATDNKSM